MASKNLTGTEQQIASNTDISLVQNSVKLFQTTNNSELYIAKGRESGSRILVKKILSEDFDLQWQSMRNIDEKIDHVTCKVPKLLAVSRETQIIYMEYIEGNSFKDAIFRRQTSEIKKQLMVDAAHWLARYHQLLAVDDDKFNPSTKLENIHRLYNRYQKKGSPTNAIKLAKQWLDDHAVRISGKKTFWGGYHGDFKPENLLQSRKDNSTYGIDYILGESSYQLMDLAQFINHILFMCLNIYGYRVFFQREKLITEFLNAYQKMRGEFDDGLLKWLRLEHLLRYYFRVSQNSQNILSRVEAGFMRFEIANLLARSP